MKGRDSMNTSKKFGVTIVGLALVASLAACSSTSATPSPTATKAAPALSGTITVLGASSLTKTFTALASAFEAANPGVTVQTTFNGSGALVTQIQQGAPADVFAAAAAGPMQTLTTANLLDGTSSNFATNTLEIAVPPSNPAGITSFADLAKPGLKLVICAVTEPCGASTVAMEKVENVTLKPVSLEPAVANVLTAVSSGQADAGLVYKTDVLGAAGTVKGVTFADSGKVVNTYPIAVLKESTNKKVAAAFVAYIESAKGQAVLKAAGFGSAS
jgi:molybdate transport system substrate-binding protein